MRECFLSISKRLYRVRRGCAEISKRKSDAHVVRGVVDSYELTRRQGVAYVQGPIHHAMAPIFVNRLAPHAMVHMNVYESYAPAILYATC